MSSESKKPNRDLLTAIALAITVVTKFGLGVIAKGAVRKDMWSQRTLGIWLVFGIWFSLIVYAPHWSFTRVLTVVFPSHSFGVWIQQNVSRPAQIGVVMGASFICWLFAFGILDWIRIARFQKCIDHLGLKIPTGLTPKVVKVSMPEGGRSKISVLAVGIDIQSFRDKKGALESSLNAIVQEVRLSPTNKQVVELHTVERELPTSIRFEEESVRLTKPYTFLVGQTLNEFLTADLCEIHHLLIAGATGGGKSVFFKQALIGILKSSRFLQLYLVDLKRGVEFKPFDVLDNVEIAKDEATAISLLQRIVTEMERRFAILAEKGFNEIDPERDSLDRIVIAIDEASVLFTATKGSSEKKAQANTARELTDQIAKLGRAAGIHLVLATQKVVKETIDTRVQTNINAKMCFRVNTIASSMTVLNNKKAAELPDVKGRAIWSVGSNDLVVQVPNLATDDVKEELDQLTGKFNGEASPLKQRMLKAMVPVADRAKAAHFELPAENA